MKNIVLKFGGSSQCVIGMETLLKNVKSPEYENHKIVLVISAVQKTTNMLYDIAMNKINRYDEIYEVHKKYCNDLNINFENLIEIFDKLKWCIEQLYYSEEALINITQLRLKIISFGEILASKIVSMYLSKQNIENILVNARQFITNNNSYNEIDPETLNIKGTFEFNKEKFNELTEQYKYIITQGFIASTINNGYCVLTRSGSNTTASLIASGLKSERLEIWTDVSGLYTADPRKIKDAKIIENISYDMCQEAAAMGSQIVHPFSIKPCQNKNIPIYIKNTFDMDSKGTVISDKYEENTFLIAKQDNVTIFDIESLDMWESYGIASDIFRVFKSEMIDINIITTSQFSVSTTTNEKSETKIERVYNKLKKNYSVNAYGNNAIISVILQDSLNDTRFHKIQALIEFKKWDIRMVHYGANNKSISFVIHNKVENKADKFIEFIHNLLVK